MPPKSLTQLEAILNCELPLIEKKDDRVVSLMYLGVTALGSIYSTGDPSLWEH